MSKITAPIFKNWRTYSERVDKFISDEYFTSVNLTSKCIIEQVNINIHHLKIITNPDKSNKENGVISDTGALSFTNVKNSDQWEIVESSFTFGPTWSVHWFKLNFKIPESWFSSKKLGIFEIHWKNECENLVYSSEGKIINGLNSNHNRIEIKLSDCLNPLEPHKEYTIYIQTSCNGLFGAGNNGLINYPNENKTFAISVAKLVFISKFARNLSWDFQILLDIAKNMPNRERGYQALYTANHVINLIVKQNMLSNDIQSNNQIQNQINEILTEFYSTTNGSSQITLNSMGHCHIDTAWLWRFVETRRKLARSWSSTLQLMKRHPNMTFVCSQAQQMQWLLEDYPDLFKELQQMSNRNQFIPVGGTWVEMDVNMPCFESLCRQFYYGQKFFKNHFKKYCTEFWLPDTFGYSAQLPQIMKLAGISRFMTQKISWSLVNKFPHHTFWWQGLDGSKVLTHFPPGDSYSMEGKIDEILKTAENCMDKGRTSNLMYLYGYGDGGQGPNEKMLHFIDRMKDCDGMPKMRHSTSTEFFDSINKQNICTWRGELYLELHNATYTSQRHIKQLNAHCEWLLKLVDMLLVQMSLVDTFHSKSGDLSYRPNDMATASISQIMQQLDNKWQNLLLCQFHDVLPGSCIYDVAEDAYWLLNQIVDWSIDTIDWITNNLSVLVSSNNQQVFYNPTISAIRIPLKSITIEIPALTTTKVPNIVELSSQLKYTENPDDTVIIDNQYFTVTFDKSLDMTQLTLKSQQNIGNLLRKNTKANVLMMYDDVPLFWDAWDVMDYHLETGIELNQLCDVSQFNIIANDNRIELTVQLKLRLTDTKLIKKITIYDSIDYINMQVDVLAWCEQHKLLKVRCVSTRANPPHVNYSCQSGYLPRDNSRNTSWQSAQYEVCSHRWIDVSEANWGLAVFKDAIYGSSLYDGLLDLSLLRSPASPDPLCDKSHLPHHLSYALYPYSKCDYSSGWHYARINQLSEEYQWNCVLNQRMMSPRQMDMSSSQFVTNNKVELSLPFTADVPAISIDWIQLKHGATMDTCNSSVVMRLNEQSGGTNRITVNSAIPINSVELCDIMHQSIDTDCNEHNLQLMDSNKFEVDMSPFQVVLVCVEFK